MMFPWLSNWIGFWVKRTDELLLCMTITLEAEENVSTVHSSDSLKPENK